MTLCHYRMGIYLNIIILYIIHTYIQFIFSVIFIIKLSYYRLSYCFSIHPLYIFFIFNPFMFLKNYSSSTFCESVRSHVALPG